MEWLSIISTGATVGLLIVTGVYAYLVHATLREMERQRVRASAPAWTFSEYTPITKVDREQRTTAIELVNIGLGPATASWVSFQTDNERRAHDVRVEYLPLPGPVHPGERLKLRIYWSGHEPLSGFVQIKCENRFGEPSPARRFHVYASAPSDGPERISVGAIEQGNP